MSDRYGVVTVARNGWVSDLSMTKPVTKIDYIYVGPTGEVKKTYNPIGLEDLDGNQIFLEEVNE